MKRFPAVRRRLTVWNSRSVSTAKKRAVWADTHTHSEGYLCAGTGVYLGARGCSCVFICVRILSIVCVTPAAV